MAAPSSPLGRRLSESGQPRPPAAVRLAALEVPVDADADDAAPAAPPPMRRLSIPEEAGAGVAASEAAATEAVERARAAAVAAASAPPLSPVHGKAGQLASEAAAAVARRIRSVLGAHRLARAPAGCRRASRRRWRPPRLCDGLAPCAGCAVDGRRPPPEFRSTLPPPPPGRTLTAAGAAQAAQGMRVARRRVARFGEGAPRNARLRLAILRAGNPLGYSPQLRALWRWRAFAGGEYRQAVIEEARRLRGERDAATERERGLKRGIATLREEKAKLDDEVATARARRRRPTATLRRRARGARGGAIAAERDALMRKMRDERGGGRGARRRRRRRRARAGDRRATAAAQRGVRRRCAS